MSLITAFFQNPKYKPVTFSEHYLDKVMKAAHARLNAKAKDATKQKSKYSTICYEFPKSKGDPYYPINDERNRRLFNKYNKLIKKAEKNNIYFEGRLAKYRYLNMDEVIECALLLFNKLKKKYK